MLARDNPTFMRGLLREVMTIMFEIADCQEFDDSTRRTHSPLEKYPLKIYISLKE